MAFREREGSPVQAYREKHAPVPPVEVGPVIAGVMGTRVRIYKIVLWTNSASTVDLLDGQTRIAGEAFVFPIYTSAVIDLDEHPLELADGADFGIEVSGDVTGWVQYTQTV